MLTIFIDQAKRKMLPAWIREGLERIEQEKQRRLEASQNSGKDDTMQAHKAGSRPAERRKSKFVSILETLNWRICRILTMKAESDVSMGSSDKREYAF